MSACAVRASARRTRSVRRASARGRGLCSLIVRRRASQPRRSAVSGLIGPAPSMKGGSSSLTCTISVVGLRRTPPTSPARVASVTSASAADCCQSSTTPACLSSARWVLAISQIACSKAAPCSSGRRPLRQSSRRPRVQVMLNARRLYSVWSSSTGGGASLRATSPIALGALPTATRTSSTSVAGVANSTAAAT